MQDFLDTPLKYYSSGMEARLAFSVAVCLQPAILLLDEVLAVGDKEFARAASTGCAAFTPAAGTLMLVFTRARAGPGALHPRHLAPGRRSGAGCRHRHGLAAYRAEHS